MKSEHIKRQRIRSIFTPVTLAITGILTVGLVLISLIIVFLGRNPAPQMSADLVITYIPAPSLTPKAIDPTKTPTSTPTSIFFLPEGVVGVGVYVQVTGTDGAGLRMRKEPGLGSEVYFSAMDSEVFLVIDGPITADGYTWWHLEAPYDRNRNGWSAADFMVPIKEDVE